MAFFKLNKFLNMTESETENIIWYKKALVITYSVLAVSFLLLLGQCSTNNKLNIVQQRQSELEKRLIEDGVYVRSLEPTVRLTIEKQFTQNLLYNDQLNKKQITTTDIINKLNDINIKINKQNAK